MVISSKLEDPSEKPVIAVTAFRHGAPFCVVISSTLEYFSVIAKETYLLQQIRGLGSHHWCGV